MSIIQLRTTGWQCFTSTEHCDGCEIAYNELSRMVPFFVNKASADILDHVSAWLKPDGLMPFDARQERAVSKIQQAWRNAIDNPAFLLCQRRLTRELDDLLTMG